MAKKSFFVPKPLRATVDKNRVGTFLVFDDKSKEDLRLHPAEVNRFYSGDRVRVTWSSQNKRDIQLIAHPLRFLIGKYQAHPLRKNEGSIDYVKKKKVIRVFLKNVSTEVLPGDWLKVEVMYRQGKIFGNVLQHYGPGWPPERDVDWVASHFQWEEQHSFEAIQEASTFSEKTIEATLPDRKDLRSLPFMTIDGETARDFDDAVYVEKKEKGFFLWVAIADVSHYVREKSALDQEAFQRGTSVYFPERAFHMLPASLSEEWCSLKPNVPRLALVARLHFSLSGEQKAVELLEAVIQSHRRATYSEIQSEWEAFLSQKNEVPPFLEAAFLLFQVLKKKREQRGSIDFDFPEPEVKVNSKTGEVQAITLRSRLEAHRLIEEFMIAANEGVTDWAMQRKAPFLYRIHPQPDVLSIQKFQNFLKSMGIFLKISKPEDPAEISAMVKKLSQHPSAVVLQQLLLRSMKQASYAATHDVHYGLASKGYTHFTSPIRRYPDLVVHRLLKKLMQGKFEKIHALETVAAHCNERERLAVEAEREAIRLKQVRFIERYVGEVFTGTIVGMVRSGFFVQLQDPYVDGLVSEENLGWDYRWDEQRMIFRHAGQQFLLGDVVSVQVARVDIEKLFVDFVLKSKKGSKVTFFSNPEKKAKRTVFGKRR